MEVLENNNKIVVTVVGKDTKGIIGKVATKMAENSANILEISQTILQGYFTMIMVVELENSKENFAPFKEAMNTLGEEMGMAITCMHQDIFQFMHRI